MKIRRKQREMRTHAIPWAILSSVIVLCFFAYLGVQSVFGIINTWIEDLPSIEDTDFTHFAQESIVYADDETTVLAEFQLEKREPIKLDQISPYVIMGTIDTEDVRFRDHKGVDLPGIARAVINNLRGGALEGASTITQQLIRNTILTQEANEISLRRKAREAELAFEMEKRYSKDEILLMYLNTINYGDGCYGIEAAALNYFQVSAADLTLTQAATLAGIPQSPNSLNPKEHPNACLRRRNVVLSRILAAGDITQEEYDAAAAEDLGLNPAPEMPTDGIYAYPYFTSYVRELLLAEDNPYNCSYADLFKGGLTIYTSINPYLQNEAEAACAAQCNRMDPSLDAALVAVDTQTGQVKAMVGGKDYAASQVNIATGTGGSGRQAGSSFKVFTLAAAIEQGISPQTPIDCRPHLTKTIDGQNMNFENFGNADYGIRSIQRATAVSSNTGYLRLSEAIGQAASNEMAVRLGVTSPLSTVYTTTLGVADITPLDMASAYATLATNGIKHDSVVVTKIVNREGETIYEAPDTGKRVLDERVASATTRVLRGVFESSEGTAWGAGPSNGQPVAGKTGTSSNFADHWLVGYTPSLSVAAWIGNPMGAISTVESLTCNILWKDFINRALSGVPIEQFELFPDPLYNNPFNKAQIEKMKAEEEAKEQEEKEREERERAEQEEDKPTPPAPTTGDPNSAPNTVGKTFEEAQVLLSGYNAGYLQEHSDSVPKGIVMRQSVQNNQVVIVVSLGPKSG